MNKYLFIFKNQNVLVNAKNKIEAINILNSKFSRLMENDFQVVTVGIELDNEGKIIFEDDV